MWAQGVRHSETIYKEALQRRTIGLVKPMACRDPPRSRCRQGPYYVAQTLQRATLWHEYLEKPMTSELALKSVKVLVEVAQHLQIGIQAVALLPN